MFRLIHAALPVLLLAGCYQIAPNTAGAPAAQQTPAFGTLPEAVQRERLRARALKRLELESLPGASFADVMVERVEAVGGRLVVGSSSQTAPPGWYWVITVKGRWESATAMGRDLCEVLEVYEARQVFAVTTGEGAWQMRRGRNARIVPAAMLNLPTAAERTTLLQEFERRL